MRPPLDGTVIVTGASSGIGRAMAVELADRARHLVLVARRRELLEELREELVASRPGLAVTLFPCDLLDREATDRMLEGVAREVGDVDVLINNAGFGDMGVFDRVDWGKTERMIRLNCESVVYLTRRLVTGMVERGRGGILNVSSGFGLEFMPGFSTYIATKHFLSGLTESMRLELRGVGVVVSQVCPGPVATEFESHIGNFTGQKPPSFIEISPERCARAAIRGFARGRALVIPGFWIKLLMGLGAISPRWLKRLVYLPIATQLRRAQLRGDSP